MVTYGFYNSINHDRVYDATQMSEIFDGIIRDGVYQYVGNKFSVDKNGLEGFQIRVGTGRAWINHTWTKNDAPLILTLPAPPTLDNYYRADAIVIDINANVNVRENKITYVTGTEVANNPSPPYPELLDGEHKQVPLAYIVRRGAETEINAANINYVVGSNPCPYVTAPVQAVDLTAHVAAWQAAWEQWFYDPNGYIKTQERAFEDQIEAAENLVNNATSDVTEEVAEFRVWIASQKSQFNGWMNSTESDFDAWFRNLQYILDGDVAGHLQNEIEALDNRIVPVNRGGTGNAHGHIQSGFKDTDYQIGEFATSEGMNTVSPGKCAHSEGGGNYTYQYQDAHLEGDRYYVTDETNPSYIPGHHYTIPVSVTVTGSENEDVNTRLMGNYAFYTTNDTYKFTDDDVISAYLCVVLKNETTGTVLKHAVYCIGSSCVNDEAYPIGNTEGFADGDDIYYRFPFQYSNGREGYANYANYWYMDGDTPENSTLLIRGTPYINIKTTGVQSTRYDVAYGGNSNSWQGTSSGYQDPNLIIKAGNTDTYSYKTYYSYALKSEAIAAGYTLYQLPPSSDETYDFSVSSTETRYYGVIDSSVSSQTHTYKSYAIVKNGIALYSRNIKSIPTNSSGRYIIYENSNDDVSIYIRVDTTSSGNGYVYNGYIDAVYTVPVSGYSIVFSYDPITYVNPYKMINDVATGFSYPIKFVPAGDNLTLQKYPTRAIGDYSHAEGKSTKAYGYASHAEGIGGGDYVDDSLNPGAYGYASHVEGISTRAIGDYSHAEGDETCANGKCSHSGGIFTESNGNYSFAHGYYVKANDIAQTVFGYDAHNSGKDGDSNQIKHVKTSILGFGSYPRYMDSSKNESSGLSSIEEANEIVDKNRSGFTIALKCGLTKNSIYYKVLMPNDTFGTFIELIELIEGDPNDKYVAYSGRILKMYPIGLDGSNCGIVEAAKLFDSNSLTNIMVPSVGTNVSIGGVNYKYPIINIVNSIDVAVSTTDIPRFIKYSLIRLI